jgi:hypothetical protein
MFEIIGLLAVTFIWGWIALIPLGIALVPSDMPNWQRLICFTICAGIIVGWFMVIGPYIHISVG